MQLQSNLIALDVDGVLLNYHVQYAKAWERAFGVTVQEVDPTQYWPQKRYGLAFLKHEPLEQFRAQMDAHFWSTMPLIEGAREGCELLVQKGYTLVCVSALDVKNHAHRWQNLKDLRLPIAQLYATGNEVKENQSPKAGVINTLKPGAFVDDFAPYFKGVGSATQKVLIDRNPQTSPNHTPECKALGIEAYHDSLWDFAQHLLPYDPKASVSPGAKPKA